MLTVVVRAGLLPQQVDGFPDGCKRSCKGAVHIKPGTLLVTDGELEYIRKSRPELRSYLQLISRPAKPPAAPVELPNDPPGGSEDEPPPETETEITGTTEESKPPKRPKKRRFLPDAH